MSHHTTAAIIIPWTGKRFDGDIPAAAQGTLPNYDSDLPAIPHAGDYTKLRYHDVLRGEHAATCDGSTVQTSLHRVIQSGVSCLDGADSFQ